MRRKHSRYLRLCGEVYPMDGCLCQRAARDRGGPACGSRQDRRWADMHEPGASAASRRRQPRVCYPEIGYAVSRVTTYEPPATPGSRSNPLSRSSRCGHRAARSHTSWLASAGDMNTIRLRPRARMSRP